MLISATSELALSRWYSATALVAHACGVSPAAEARHPVHAATRLTLLVIAAVAMIIPAFGQDRMVLGPRQFEQDKSGAGAVLCSWSIYLSIQNQVAACALPRRPVDDAIDQAIVAIDEFILANSSLHPSKPMLEDFKRS
jgi:hypothetical protein